MGFELFVAGRYLKSKRRTGFISLITYISAGGVMIGVAALVIVLSVANGFELEVRDRIIGTDAHIRLTMFHEEPMEDFAEVTKKVSTLPEVRGGSPFISGKGMLRFGQSVEPVIIKAVDEDTEGLVSNLPQTIIAGRLRLRPLGDAKQTDSSPNAESQGEHEGERPGGSGSETVTPSVRTLVQRAEREMPGIILGKHLSFRLGVVVGDSIIALSPEGMTGLFSTPQMKRFIVTGIFETGIYEYDDTYAYISIEAGQDLFLMKDAVTGVAFSLTDLDQAEQVKIRIEKLVGYPHYIRTWYDMHRTLFRWMKMEKWLYTILLSLIILVAAFNIVSSQIMLVLEKKREIGILKAMGSTRWSIMKIFLYEGLIVGVAGTVLGLILGWVVCYGQQRFHWLSLPGDVYFLSTLPVRMQVPDFLVITVVSLTLTILATVYPARRASMLDPVTAIRYE